MRRMCATTHQWSESLGILKQIAAHVQVRDFGTTCEMLETADETVVRQFELENASLNRCRSQVKAHLFQRGQLGEVFECGELAVDHRQNLQLGELVVEAADLSVLCLAIVQVQLNDL